MRNSCTHQRHTLHIQLFSNMCLSIWFDHTRHRCLLHAIDVLVFSVPPLPLQRTTARGKCKEHGDTSPASLHFRWLRPQCSVNESVMNCSATGGMLYFDCL